MDKRIDVKATAGAVVTNTVLQGTLNAIIPVPRDSEVRIFAAQDEIASMQRAGDDLIVRYADGTVVRLAEYFASSTNAIPALLLDDQHASDGIEHVYKITFEPHVVPPAQGITDTPLAFSWTLIASDGGTSDSSRDDSKGMVPWLLGGLGMLGAGAGVVIAATGGGSSRSHSDISAMPNEVGAGGGAAGGGTGGGTNTESGTSDPTDTTAPLAPTVFASNNNGGTSIPILSGASTNDNTPELSGTAEVGSTVKIYEGKGDSPVATVLVGADGKWSYTPTTALSDATYTYSVNATDAAGNVSDGAQLTLTVDTVVEAVTDLAIDATGFNVTGHGEVGATVTVFDADANPLGTAIVDENGVWSATLSAAQTSAEPLSVSQTDRAGNVSASASLVGVINVVAADDHVEVDYVGAFGDIANANPGVLHNAFPSSALTSTVDANVLTSSNAYVFTVENDGTPGVTLNGSIIKDQEGDNDFSLYLYQQQSDGSWSLMQTIAKYIVPDYFAYGVISGEYIQTGSFAAGTYALVIGSDNALVSTSINTISFTLASTVTLPAEVTGNLLANDTSSLSGTIPEGTVVSNVSGYKVGASGEMSITTDHGIFTITSNGDYTYTLNAGLDPNTLPSTETFTYTVKDAKGVETSAILTVTLHSSTPVITAISNDNDPANPTPLVIPNNGFTNDATPVLSGTGKAGSLITIFDPSGTPGYAFVGSDGTWHYTTYGLSDGTHSFVVTATDAQGYISANSNTYTVTVDTVLPDASTLLVFNDDSLAYDFVNGDTTRLIGSATPGAVVTISDGTTVVGTTTVAYDGVWDVQVPSSSDASSALMAKVATANNGWTNDNTPLLSGIAGAGMVVTVYDATRILGTATVGEDGTWFFQTPTLSDGSHTLTTTVTNESGSVSALSAAVTINVDTMFISWPAVTMYNDNGVTLLEIPNTGSTNDTTPRLSGTSEPGATLLINSYSGGRLGFAIAAEDGTWSVVVDTGVKNDFIGLYVIPIDLAGNVGLSTWLYLAIDTTPPVISGNVVLESDAGATPVTVANGGSTNDRTPVLSGTGEGGIGTTVTVSEGSMVVGTAVIEYGDTWHVTTSELADGKHTFTLTATDRAGNVTVISDVFTVNVDTSIPDAQTDPDTTSFATSSQPIDAVTWHYLTGTTADDTLMGTDGNDYIDGGTGADSLYGGLGDDLLVFNANATVIDGGAGDNTLLIEDLIASILGATTPVANVDAIKFANDGAAHTLTLDATGADKAAGTGAQLMINGTASDAVNLTGATDTGHHVLINSQTYEAYTLGHTTVLIQEPVQVHVTPA